MRVSLPARRPPTLLEQLVGRQRVRWLRRRLGLAALGMSYSLLKPRSRAVPALCLLTLVAVVAIRF